MLTVKFVGESEPELGGDRKPEEKAICLIV